MSTVMQTLALAAGRPTLERLREFQAAGERRALEAYAELLETDTRRLSFPESSRWFAAVERAAKTVARMIAEREKANAKAEADGDAQPAEAMPAKSDKKAAAAMRSEAGTLKSAPRQTAGESAKNSTVGPSRSAPTPQPTDEELAAAVDWLNAAVDKHFPSNAATELSMATALSESGRSVSPREVPGKKPVAKAV